MHCIPECWWHSCSCCLSGPKLLVRDFELPLRPSVWHEPQPGRVVFCVAKKGDNFVSFTASSPSPRGAPAGLEEFMSSRHFYSVQRFMLLMEFMIHSSRGWIFPLFFFCFSLQFISAVMTRARERASPAVKSKINYSGIIHVCLPPFPRQFFQLRHAWSFNNAAAG